MARRKNPRVMNTSDLESKGTKELLGYLKKLQRCEQSILLSDFDEDHNFDDNLIYFKDSKKWKDAYSDVKAILSSRENIEK